MDPSKIIPGIILIGAGLLFIFNNKNISEATFKFYRKLYTKNNLKIMFKACGILCMIGGSIFLLSVLF